MSPIEALKEEHEVVHQVLGAAERESESIRTSGRIDLPKVEKLVEFFEGFVERCHHAKEERHLFLMLVRHGMAGPGSLVEQLQRDHELGRNMAKTLVAELVGARDRERAAIDAVGFNLVNYARLLRAHIQREEKMLFPQVSGLLKPEEQAAVMRGFDRVETDDVGTGVHERLHALAGELAEEVRSG